MIGRPAGVGVMLGDFQFGAVAGEAGLRPGSCARSAASLGLKTVMRRVKSRRRSACRYLHSTDIFRRRRRMGSARREKGMNPSNEVLGEALGLLDLTLSPVGTIKPDARPGKDC